ncbi:cell division protein FtsA [mine drainage metagenome]|uniref:Cell division protein FtsA n=1 Tax=mine drainage metagenome TaxID=410659 RepID=A0A1J5R093_9ZZZZ
MASTRVIGLDIGTSFARAIELQFGRGGADDVTVVRHGQIPLPRGAVRDGEVVDSHVVSSELRRLWAETKFDSRDVVIGVGNQRVIVRELELPWMPAVELRKSLPFQVQELLPMPIDDALLDFFPTSEFDGEQGRMISGMLVAAQRGTISANVLAVEGAGLRPTMVDLNSFALLRALARGDLAQRVIGIVDVGASVTHVAVVAHGVPRLVRILSSGGHDITNAVAHALGVSGPEAEALKREIGVGFAVTPDRESAGIAVSDVAATLIEAVRNTFVYYSGNNPGAAIELVVMTGGGSQLVGLGQYLSSASRLPVTIGNPLAGLKMGKSVSSDALAGFGPYFALSVGLAYGVAA